MLIDSQNFIQRKASYIFENRKMMLGVLQQTNISQKHDEKNYSQTSGISKLSCDDSKRKIENPTFLLHSR